MVFPQSISIVSHFLYLVRQVQHVNHINNFSDVCNLSPYIFMVYLPKLWIVGPHDSPCFDEFPGLVAPRHGTGCELSSTAQDERLSTGVTGSLRQPVTND